MSADRFVERLSGMESIRRAIDPTQRTAARIAGALYLVQMATAIFSYALRGQFTVRDAAQTAKNIATSSSLFRITIVSDLITCVAVITMLWALYVILRPINRNLALLAAFLRLVENSIIAAGAMSVFTALRLLSDAPYLRAFETPQLQALARLFLAVHGSAFNIGFVFCGLGSVAFSVVWLQSRYIPKALALLGIFASLVLTIVTLIIMVFPIVWSVLGLTYMIPMFFYEVGLGLWLLIKGLPASDQRVRP